MSVLEASQGSSLSAVEQQVMSGITEKAWLDLACELIPAGQPEAENPLDPEDTAAREEGIALLIADKLTAMGFSVELKTKREGRPNVVGVIAGADEGAPSLILNDHLDTYPAGDWRAWTMTGGHPFRPTRHGDRLYARGTSDTRGNLACTLLAARAIRDAGVTAARHAPMRLHRRRGEARARRRDLSARSVRAARGLHDRLRADRLDCA